MLSLTHILVATAVAALGMYWWRALAARDRALQAARRRCERLGLQLLDDTVALRRLWFKRNPRGQQSLWRAYGFEFSVTGGERYQGRVVMLGDRVEQVDLPAHLLPDDQHIH